MKILSISVLTLSLVGTLGSCVEKKENNLTAEAQSLFEKSREITLRYTDSLCQAKDSATLLRLISGYEDRMTKLNFEYPAETDLVIDEGQNDTLIKLSLRYISVRDSMLYRIAHTEMFRDTLAADSVAVNDSILSSHTSDSQSRE